MERQSSEQIEPSAFVVIADDNRAIRLLLSKPLHELGCSVEEAGSGLSLFDLLKRYRISGLTPELLIIDQQMPGLTGLEVMSRVRKWGWKTPVIMITSFADDDDVVAKARELGIAAVLGKPFDVENIRLVVRFLLQRAKRKAAKESSTQPPDEQLTSTLMHSPRKA